MKIKLQKFVTHKKQYSDYCFVYTTNKEKLYMTDFKVRACLDPNWIMVICIMDELIIICIPKAT